MCVYRVVDGLLKMSLLLKPPSSAHLLTTQRGVALGRRDGMKDGENIDSVRV